MKIGHDLFCVPEAFPVLQLGVFSFFQNLHVTTASDYTGEPSMCSGPESILELMFNHPQEQEWASLPLPLMIEKSQFGLPSYGYPKLLE